MPFGNMGGWTFVVILIIVLLLFGAPRLPRLAKSIGESMRIFKGEMKTMKGDAPADTRTSAGEAPAAGGANAAAAPGPAATNTPNTNAAPDELPSDGNDTSAR